MADRIGEVLEGKYRLVRILGQGGMGEVYEAEHTVINRKVAVKLLRAKHIEDSTMIDRFLREAKATSAIEHPNIVEIHDVGQTEDGSIFIVMELLVGQPLTKLIRSEAPFDRARATAIAVEILEGLKAAHKVGIVHRDLKPDNIFLSTDQRGQEQIKIVDFGISKIIDGGDESPDLTATGTALGTPYYMAPEQVRNSKDVDEGVDIWSVGVILFEMLTGKLPFQGNSASELLVKVLVDPVPKLSDVHSDVPPELAELVEKALAKNRDDRYQTATELSHDLKQCSPEALQNADADKATPADLGQTLPDSDDEASLPFAPTKSEKELQIDEKIPETRTDSGSEFPVWKRILWFVLACPFFLLPFLISLGRPQWVFAAFGLSDDLPIIWAWLITVILTLCFLAATIRIEAFFRVEKSSKVLHGPYFVVFPAIGFLLSLMHYLTLGGQASSYSLTFRSYMEIGQQQAQELSDLIALGNERFLTATAFDQLAVGCLSILILLGFLFVPSRRTSKDQKTGSKKKWLLIPGGLALIAVFHGVIFPDELGWMGIWVFGLYLIWVLTAFAALKNEGEKSSRALIIGVVAAVANTGSQIAFGYLMVLELLLSNTRAQLPPGDRQWMYDSQINPNIIIGLVVEWSLLCVLFLAIFVVCRLTSGGREKPEKDKPFDMSGLIARSLPVLMTALPLALLIVVMLGARDQWTVLKVADMAPASLSQDRGNSFYIDREPQSLYVGRRGLLAALTGENRDLRASAEDLPQKLTAQNDQCRQILKQAFQDEPEAEPARCITGIEARLYCEGLGKRLPTPQEWDAAVDGESSDLARGPFGEWTMRLVHGTPTFEIRGVDPEVNPSAPVQLAPDQFSPHIGFRCAWSYGDQGEVTGP